MKRKVLHVSAGGLSTGGVGSVIFSIVKELYAQIDFHCVVFEREYDQEKDFENYGKLHRIKCYPKNGKRNYLELLQRPFRLYFGIRRICKKEKFDVIHCHNQRDAWICLWAAKNSGVPIRIAHSHVTNSPRKRSMIEQVYKNLSPIILSKVSTFRIGCSDLACEQLFGKANYLVVPNSIDTERFNVNKRIETTSVNFVHVGRFNYAKNQEFVIDTFFEVSKSIENARLFIVGYGEKKETEQIADQIRKYNLSERAKMIRGDIVDVADIYAMSDYMIFPSRFEGFGIALLEAQAMNIRCYVSENIQREADVGLLTFLNLSDGPKKWADRIIADMKNGVLKTIDYEKMSKYSNKKVCQIYFDIYNS